MKRIYASPLRVYLIAAALGIWGVYAGLWLPISLFPNSSKPGIVVGIPYGSLSQEEFLFTFGRDLEKQFQSLHTGRIRVDKVHATYQAGQARYYVEFEWNTPPREALSELQNKVNAFASRLSEEARDGIWMWPDNEGSGFFAVSYFSDARTLDSLYDSLDPILKPHLAKVRDADNAVLFNPTLKEIRLELRPEAMASLKIFPQDIERALAGVLSSQRGGTITMGSQRLSIEMPRQVPTLEDLGKVTIPTPAGGVVHLSDIARIDFALSSTWTRSFKTNGASSLILYATPAPGGNIKRMSEELLEIVRATAPSLPKDVQYKVLVDPSEFIRSAVANVLREVFLAAFIATMVLFVFIGSFRSVMTAAIEIPLSMVLAFILMDWFDMNLNLISLGGLALAAGMNVDASVVVMENIIRHFERRPGHLPWADRLEVIHQAVKEVWLPVVASTLASLVVFLPLTFTSELTYAILGDLAKAVVFSHGLSAIVALILVPTIRLQLVDDPHRRPPRWIAACQGVIARGEDAYAKALGVFLERPLYRRVALGGLAALLAVLTALVLPRLPREIIGKPDTDWMVLDVSTRGNTLLSQMESLTSELESRLLSELGEKISYTFNIVSGPNQAELMARLHDKADMRPVWERMEKIFVNTPEIFYRVDAWNPSELRIPDPPHLEIAVRGGNWMDQVETARAVRTELQEADLYPRLWTEPNVSRDLGIVLSPRLEQWMALQRNGSQARPSDLADLVRVATNGRRIGYLPVRNLRMSIVARYPQDFASTPEDIASIPVGTGSRIVPLRALAEVDVKEVSPSVYREDQQEVILLQARVNKGEESKAAGLEREARGIVADWEKRRPKDLASTVTFEDPNEELSLALSQLKLAVTLSVVLIFLTLLLQFGDVVTVLLILVAVPLGLIGVVSALFLFRSTLSLNSVLGVILLNGISVANSILLADFIRRRVAEGQTPRLAAVEAGRQRLRPILITSLTTILGMLPIAIGLGEGGKVLQPLGIAVSAGLWVSTVLTLFIVPALQVGWLELRTRVPERGHPRPVRDWLARVIGPLRARRAPTHALWLALLFTPTAVAAPEAGLRSFEEAMNGIVDRSTDVAAQRAAVGRVRARTLPDRLFFLPELSVTGSHQTGQAGIGYPQGTTNAIEGKAKINAFRFGGDVAASRAAGLEVREQESLLRKTEIAAEAQAVKALVEWMQARQEVDIATRRLGLRERALGIARERYRRGLLALEEVDKVVVERDNAQATTRDAEATLARAAARLEALLGHANVETEWPWREALPGYRLPEVSAERLASRPDWQAAEAALEAAEQRKKEARGKFLPSLDLEARGGYAWEPRVGREGTLWGAGVTLSIPLFDRLTRIGEYNARAYAQVEAESRLEAVRRQARADWQGAKATFEIAASSAQAREGTVNSARRLFEANLQRFQRGLVDVNDLILDHDRLFGAEGLAVRGWAAAHLAFADACHALGRRVSECLATSRGAAAP